MTTTIDILRRAEQTVLVFGPQSLSFDAQTLQQLGQTLSCSKSHKWILKAFTDSLAYWQPLACKLSHLEDTDAKTWIDRLSQWLADGSIDDEISSWPNIILTPLVIIGHLVQYQDYLDLTDSIHASHCSRVLGFCVGLLSASAITASGNEEELYQNARNAITIAMLIGATVDAYDGAQPVGPSQSLAVAWTKSDEETVAEQIVQEIPNVSQFTGLVNSLSALTRDIIKAYISVRYDWNRVTITLPQSKIAEAQGLFATRGLTANPVALYGCFHSLSHQNVFAATLRLFSEEPSLPQEKSVFESAVRDILVETSSWYSTVKQTHEEKPSATFLTFGSEKCIPPSLIRDVGLQRIIQMIDLKKRLASPDNALSPRLGSSGDDIAVVGMSCKFAGANDISELWETLVTGKSQHREVPDDRFSMDNAFRAKNQRTWYGNFLQDHDAFDHKFFKKSPREAASMDPQQRVMLEVVYQALEQSGYFASLNPATDVGCYVGFVSNDYQNNVACHEPNAYTATGNLSSFIAGKISHYFGLTGPALVIDTACSSSAVAIHQACRAILAGECSQAIAGGALVITSPLWFQNLAGASFLSPTGSCKPFDAGADGYCRGEGVAAVILKRMSEAIADGDQIIGCIAATEVRQNLNCTPIVVPNAPSLSSLFNSVLNKAGLKPEDISVIEAHGTGTQVGDPAEWESIRNILGGPRSRQGLQNLVVGSVKGHIGHTECTSGVAALIKILLMMHAGKIPPQASFNKLNPALHATAEDRMEVSTTLKDWNNDFRAALINNYGASGSNASIIVTQPFKHRPSTKDVISATSDVRHPFMLSGNDPQSISRNASRLLKWSLEHPQYQVPDLAFNNNRKNNPTLDIACIFQAGTLAEFRSHLQSIATETAVSSHGTRLTRPVIFCFGGQISTSVSINRELYNNVAVLRKNFDVCNAAIISLGLPSILPHVFDNTSEADPIRLQTKLFAIQYSCAKTWMDCGLQVAAVVGHSFGELTALCISGILTLEDTIRVISRRAQLVKERWGSEKGAMLAVESSPVDVQLLLDQTSSLAKDQDVIAPTIACYNGPTSFTFAGSSKAIDLVEMVISKMSPKPRTKRLNVTNAFHSTLVDPLFHDLSDLTKDIVFKKPIIPLMHSTENYSDEPVDGSFVAKHLRNPVYFHQALQRLAQAYPSAVFLEAGSNSTVTNMANRALGSTSDRVFQAINLAGENAVSNLVDATTSLWKAGIRIQYWGHHNLQTQNYAICMLPPRQFARTRHWLELKKLPEPAQSDSAAATISAEPVTTALWTFMGYNSPAKSLAKFRVNTHVSEYERYFAGHIIAQEAPICPATLEIHIVVGASQSLLPSYTTQSHRPVIKNVSNQTPICKNPARRIWLEIATNKDHQGEWNWRIFSTNEQGDLGTSHVTGQISFRPTDDKNYHLDFAKYARLVNHDRCKQLLQDPQPDETITGRNIYRAFSDVVDYGDLYRCVKKLVGKGNESAGKVVLGQIQDKWFDAISTDCFSQVGGIWVNCMTDRSQATLYIANGIEEWVQSPKAHSEAPGPRTFDVFAAHRKVSSKAYCTDVFVFDADTGDLSEVIFGISYVEVSKVGIQRMLAKLTSDNSTPRLPVSNSNPTQVDVAFEPMLAAAPMASSEGAFTPGLPTKAASAVSRNSTFVSDKLKDIIGELCGLKKHEIKDNAQLADLGVDSLMSMELLKEIENVFKITVPEEDRVDVVDLPSLVAGISSLVGGVSTPDSLYSEPESEGAISDATSATSITSADETDGLKIDGKEWLAAFGAMNIDTDSCIADYGFANYLTGVDVKQTELCISMILETLEKLRCGLSALSSGDAVDRVNHTSEHKRLVDYLYQILDLKAGLIKTKNGSWVRTETPLPSKRAETVLQELHHAHPTHSDAFDLAYHCGSHLAEILQGKENGVKLIFGSPKGRDLVSKLYGSWPLNLLYYNQMASLLEHMAKKLPHNHGPLKILEMGAGTAGTTKVLLPRLAKLGIPIEYTFTDLSPSFVAAARKQFKQYDFMRFQAHDIEKMPSENLIGTQHIVIASNAVHATCDLSVSTANIKKALQPGGVLLMLEMTKPVVFIDIIFGLFEGWWLFNDGRNHAISHQSRWNSVLRSVGFADVVWTDGKRPENEIERLILAVNPSTRYDDANPSSPAPKIDLSADIFARKIAVDHYVQRFCEDWENPRAVGKEATKPARRTVLVTGATGSLGSHLVSHLISLPDVSHVVCINRKSRGDATMRQLDSLESRKIPLEPSALAKLVVYETDTSKPLLGLETSQYNWLSDHITHICHNAWPMSAARSVTGFEAQFQVMRNLIDLATDAAANQESIVGFELVSSIAVVGHYPLWTGRRVVPEERMCIRSVLPNGYGDAKYVCELMLDTTLGRHPKQYKTLVVRPGQIAGSKNSGIWNTTEHLSFLIKSCQTLSALPALEGELSWTPVEDVAGTCVDLLLRDLPSQFVYHIDNPVRQSWTPMLELWADILNIPHTGIIPFAEWIERVRSFTGKSSENPAIKLLGFLDENFMRMSCGGLLLGTKESVRDSRTMAAVGPVEDHVTRKYFKAWKDMGYLRA